MRKIKLTQDAHADLERVIVFLADKSEQVASRAYTAIADQLEKIRDYPSIYRPRGDTLGHREAVLAFGSHGYVIRYVLDADTDTVIILRIWHQREDISP